MDMLEVFVRGAANRGKPRMVFDWDMAARLIRERGAASASAGLCGDWAWTGGEILRNGKPIPKDDTYVYLASTWATPELSIDEDVVDCYIMEDEVPAEWLKSGEDYPSIYWPASALSILNK